MSKLYIVVKFDFSYEGHVFYGLKHFNFLKGTLDFFDVLTQKCSVVIKQHVLTLMAIILFIENVIFYFVSIKLIRYLYLFLAI
jgi:hypothetical protein